MIIQELFSVLGLQTDKESFNAGEKALDGLKKVAGAVAAAFAVSKIAGWFEHVAEVADASLKASSALGVTTEALQQLDYAAKLSDVSSEELQAGIRHMSAGLEDLAKTGKGPAADALSSLGLSFSDLKGKKPDEQIAILSDAFAKLPDGAKKASASADLFGRALGGKFIPLLNGGADSLAELADEAVRTGNVIGEDASRQFEEFNDANTKIGATWQGLKNQVVLGLLPMVMKLQEAFSHFVEENRELISTGVEVAMRGVAAAFELVFKGVSAVLKVISALQEDKEVFEAILISIGAVLTAFAIKAALAWVMAAAPVILLVLAIAGIAVGVLKLIKHWDKVKAVVKSALSTAWSHVVEFKNALLGVPASIVEAFQLLGESLVDALVGAFDAMVQLAKDAAKDMWKAIKDIPVVGKLASGAEAAADFAFGSGGDAAAPSFMDQLLPQPTDSVSGAAGGGGGISAQFDTTVSVAAGPGMNEEKLAQLAAEKAAEAQRRMLNDAASMVRGGRR